MQGEKSTSDSSHVTEQGLASNSSSIDRENSWNNLLDPVESRLSNYMLSPNVGRFHNLQSSGGWQLGESSTNGNQQSQVKDNNFKAENSWPSAFHPHGRAGSTLDEMETEPANILLNERADVGLHSSQFFSQTARMAQNYNLESGPVGYGQTLRPFESPNVNYTGGLETGNVLSANVFFTGVEASTSLGNVPENGGASCSSSSFGLSCKRKALESTYAQSHAIGSPSCFPQSENLWHPVPSGFCTSGALTISPPPVNIPVGNPPDSINLSGRPGRMIPFDTCPPGILENNESSVRNFNRRTRLGLQLEDLYPDTFVDSRRHSNINSIVLSRPFPMVDRSEFIPASINALPHHSHVIHPGSSRHVRTFSYSGTPHLRVGSSLASLIPPDSEVHNSATSVRHEGENMRHTQRNHIEHLMLIPASEPGYFGQDPTARRLSTGDVSTPAGIMSPSRLGPGSTFHASGSAMWLPNNNVPPPPTQLLERLGEISPWSMFMPVNSEPDRNSVFPRSGSLGERRHDVSRGLSHSFRSVAAEADARQRIIHQFRQAVLAMQEEAQFRAEEYMLYDPIMFREMVDLHDRHRDMRLDVDNMSYEELLALEERIGDVKTGLSEEMVVTTMKQRKFSARSELNLEPCCICREEYFDGDDVGRLVCSHDFHSDCIKQWLMHKNLCPVCKTTALDI